MEPPDAVNPPPSVRRDALPRRRAADARHADAGKELWRIVLLGTLPIVLALPLPGAAALAITSLSVPPPPVAPERQGMLQAKHPCSPPCQVALVPQRPAHPTATTTESRRYAVESLLHVAAAAAIAERDVQSHSGPGRSINLSLLPSDQHRYHLDRSPGSQWCSALDATRSSLVRRASHTLLC